jgi:hypothetical protein
MGSKIGIPKHYGIVHEYVYYRHIMKHGSHSLLKTVCDCLEGVYYNDTKP